MSETINKGWLKDTSEIKFAPKTLIEQVQDNDGNTLNTVLDNTYIRNDGGTLNGDLKMRSGSILLDYNEDLISTSAEPSLDLNGTNSITNKSLTIKRGEIFLEKEVVDNTNNTTTSFSSSFTAEKIDAPTLCESGVPLEGLYAGIDHNHIASAITNLLNVIYPVGSIYMSAVDNNPSTFIGGTWERWGAGKVPVGVDETDDDFASAELMGGEKTHTLTVDELLAHGHLISPHSHGLNNHTHTVGSHSHTLNSHTHSIPAHAHGLNSHTHTIGSHVHSVGAHSHGLNSHTHSVGAHAHGLNSHTHSIPALSGTAASNGAHTHNVEGTAGGAGAHSHRLSSTKDAASGTAKNRVIPGFDASYVSSGVGMESAGTHEHPVGATAYSAGAHTHSVSTTASTTGKASGNTANSTAFNTGAASGSTANSTAFNTGGITEYTSGKASGNTANSSALTSGGASGNTGSSAVFYSGEASGSTAASSQLVTETTGGHAAHNNMQPYVTCYMWKRVA